MIVQCNNTAKITGKTAKIPGTNKVICQTTIPMYKQLISDSSHNDYHPENLKKAYSFLSGNNTVNDICMLIQDGYIYMFPESKECVEEDYNTLLIAKNLF